MTFNSVQNLHMGLLLFVTVNLDMVYTCFYVVFIFIYIFINRWEGEAIGWEGETKVYSLVVVYYHFITYWSLKAGSPATWCCYGNDESFVADVSPLAQPITGDAAIVNDTWFVICVYVSLRHRSCILWVSPTSLLQQQPNTK